MIGALTNSGAISGGSGGRRHGQLQDGTITTLTNAAGGKISTGAIFSLARNVIGAAGVANSGAIATLMNSGAISGGEAVGSSAHVVGGAGSSNSGTIKTLTNSGAIREPAALTALSASPSAGGGGASPTRARSQR